MHSVLVDVFEDPKIELLLSRTLKVTRTNMVPLGLGDIVWHGADYSISLEHKTFPQVFSEMGNRLDIQLRKHTEHAAFVGLVIDGMVTPITGRRECQVWRMSSNGQVFYQAETLHKGWEEVTAYIHSLQTLGISTYTFPTLDAMCLGISAMVYNSHKTSHATLQTNIKKRLKAFKPDPFVETLMGLGQARIGEITAKKILAAYETPYRAFLQSEDSWTLSPGIYHNMMKAIGKEV